MMKVLKPSLLTLLTSPTKMVVTNLALSIPLPDNLLNRFHILSSSLNPKHS